MFGADSLGSTMIGGTNFPSQQFSYEDRVVTSIDQLVENTIQVEQRYDSFSIEDERSVFTIDSNDVSLQLNSPMIPGNSQYVLGNSSTTHGNDSISGESFTFQIETGS